MSNDVNNYQGSSYSDNTSRMDNVKDARGRMLSKNYEILDTIQKNDQCETKKVLHFKSRKLRLLKIFDKEKIDESFGI